MSEEVQQNKPTFYIPRVEATETDPEQTTWLIECGCGGTFTYGRGPHTTWTTWGEKVMVADVEAFRCDGCGQVGLTDTVSRALDVLIISARGQLAPQS